MKSLAPAPLSSETSGTSQVSFTKITIAGLGSETAALQTSSASAPSNRCGVTKTSGTRRRRRSRAAQPVGEWVTMYPQRSRCRANGGCLICLLGD